MGVGLFLATAEVAVRTWDPTPRLQIIRSEDHDGEEGVPIHRVDGEPVWEDFGTVPRRNAGCDGDAATDVVLLGSSITFGVRLAPEDTVGARLQGLLDGARPWCVRNHAQPGFTGRSKLAAAKEALPALAPEVVLWEVWHNDGGGYTMIGPDAYNLTSLPVDEQGYPRGLLPGGLHRAAFRSSAFYHYLTLALAQPPEAGKLEAWQAYVDGVLPEVLALTEAHGGRLGLVLMPPLHQPFAESAKRTREGLPGYLEVVTWAEAAGVPYLDVADALRGEDVEALRIDACCHYSAAGSARIAEVLVPFVEALAPSPEAHDGPVAPPDPPG